MTTNDDLMVMAGGEPRAVTLKKARTTSAPSTNGRYQIAGRDYPRVTTILNVLNQPSLEAWKHKVGLTESQEISRVATLLGTRVHKVCEAINRGKTPLLNESDLAPFILTYGDWFREHVAEVLAVELLVWSERYGYAGTADLVALLKDGRTALIDLKTSNSLSETYRMQTAAYMSAMVDSRNIGCDVRMIVQLPSREPGCVYVTEYDDDAGDWRAFRAALALWKWQQVHKGDWKITGKRWR